MQVGLAADGQHVKVHVGHLEAGDLQPDLRRPERVVETLADDLGDEHEVLRDLRDDIALGIGVVDIKDNEVETAEEIARRIEGAVAILGRGSRLSTVIILSFSTEAARLKA